MNFDIRYTIASDAVPLQKWLSNPDNLQWFPMSTEKEIEVSVKNWIGFSKYRASLTAIRGEDVCGVGTLFLMPYKKVAHHCMFYLLVGDAYRRQGVGRSMVKNLLNLAKNYFHLESLHGEIYEGSPLFSILLKEGFTLFLRQENFVKEGKIVRARLLLEHRF